MSSIEAAPEPRNGAPKEPESCGRPHHSAEMEPEVKDRNLKRLRRIEGQVRGIQRMVEEERYCPDILVQIASIQEALRGVSREVMRNHLRHCAAEAVKEGGDAAEAMQGELLDLMYRYLS